MIHRRARLSLLAAALAAGAIAPVVSAAPAFSVHKDAHGDTHVVPEDAVALLPKGKLDPLLFDGTSWQPATVTPHRDEWLASVDHPRDARFVSLRSSVTEQDGTAQQQTIIRAYALKPPVA